MSKSKDLPSHERHLLRRVLAWIGGHELSVLVSLLLIAIGVLAFIAIADEVFDGDTIGFDEWALRVLRSPADLSKPIGPLWLAEAARDMTALGGVLFLTLLTASVVGFLWLRKMYGAMALVIAATLGGLSVSSILKNLFDRPRPNLVPHLSHVSTSSFPSGHSMLSTVVFLTLAVLLARFVHERKLRAYFLLIGLTLTTLVGVSRVFLGVHYPTDVLAGWCAGMVWALSCWFVATVLQKRGAVEADSLPD